MLNKPYSYGPYNKYNDKEQWIRISEGCPHNCSFCYEPTKYKIFKIPKIVRNNVKIMDMNFLCKPESLETIKDLGAKKNDGKVIYYEFICGIDSRFMTKNIAIALKENRFKNIRIAWDWYMEDQYSMKEAIYKLIKAGYSSKTIMVFMICNWKISYNFCCNKLDLLKIWKVKVADCYFDGQIKDIKPEMWSKEEIKSFRAKCRKHNQLINFEIDPEIKDDRNQGKLFTNI